MRTCLNRPNWSIRAEAEAVSQMTSRRSRSVAMPDDTLLASLENFANNGTSNMNKLANCQICSGNDSLICDQTASFIFDKVANSMICRLAV